MTTFQCNDETKLQFQTASLDYSAVCDACGEEKAKALLAAGFDLAQVSAICSVTAESRNSTDTLFLVLVAAVVFLMHAGFGMLCAGAIRTKNTLNILLQTVLDACVAGLCFYLIGYGLAFGTATNGFLGTSNFVLQGIDPGLDWRRWLLAWAFAATATTIPAGSVAERFSFVGYMGYTVFISCWVYPLVAHWAWAEDGWLSATKSSPLLGSGMIDFAGGTVVHMVGGLAGTMGAYIVGPRIGRYDEKGNPLPIRGHSATLVVLGTFLLWFGWYGFNPGSTGTLVREMNAIVMSRTAVTTTLAGCAGGATSLLWAFYMYNSWDLSAVCNGLLVGLVSVTAGCSVIEPWAAVIVGSIGAIIFDFACRWYLYMKIDDPLAAGPMHGICGMWGALFVGLLAKKEYILEVFPVNSGIRPYGLFYGGNGKLLACQVIGIVVVGAWVVVLMGAFFMALFLAKCLRISPEEELKGLDLSKHGASAYYTQIDDGEGTLNGKPGASNVDDSLEKLNG